MLSGTSAKQYGLGTERVCHPLETLERITPYLALLGVTRVANVTGLDRIGIPVYMVVRPNSRSLAVTQGKGVDAAAAKVSGIMEALEQHHAEFTTISLQVGGAAELGQHLPLVDPLLLPLSRKGAFSFSVDLPWVEGFDLIGRCPMWVPYEAVHLNLSVPPVAGSGWFTRTSNGLASGNNMVEAVLHALCELVERDAEARWNDDRAEALMSTRLILETVDDPLCRGLLDQCHAAGTTVMAWTMPSPIGLPVIRAVLFDRQADPDVYPAPAARGNGCHPNRAIAFSRALTEAAQGRLTIIAGSREDLSRSTYKRIQSRQTLAFQARMANEPGSVSFGRLPTTAAATFEEEAMRILEAFQGAGFHHAVAVDLSRPEWPVKVVKMIIPGLAPAAVIGHRSSGTT